MLCGQARWVTSEERAAPEAALPYHACVRACLPAPAGSSAK